MKQPVHLLNARHFSWHSITTGEKRTPHGRSHPRTFSTAIAELLCIFGWTLVHDVALADRDTDNIAAIERACEQLQNDFRKQNQKSELSVDEGLRTVARKHSADMLRRGYFSQGSPDGKDVSDRFAEFYPRLFGGPGENIFRMRGPSVSKSAEEVAARIINGWENSPPHRENMLHTGFTHAAVGIALEGDQLLATCNFAEEIAVMDEPLPSVASEGDQLVISGTVRGRVTLQQAAAYLVIPDPRMRCSVPDEPNAYAVGGCFLKVIPELGNRFSVSTRLDKGKGAYEFKMGQSKSGQHMFFPGWKITVQ